MNLRQAVAHEPFLLFEGAVIERLRRDAEVDLDPHILHAALVYDPVGRSALQRVYRSYLDIGRAHDLPVVVLTPTWRANPERLARAGFDDSARVNGDGARFLASVRDTYDDYAPRIWIGGLIGPRGDAYRPQEALAAVQAHRFHVSQARALAESNVDFLIASTLPAFSEALGMARAMADIGLAYLLSFVVRPTGTLLDGTPLEKAIAEIDTAIDPPPLRYMINCVHPTVFEQALDRATDLARTRLLGLQANTSPKPPEELDNAADLESQDPDRFALAMIHVYEKFGLRALGGCCGTDDRHIAAIARHIMPAVC